MGTIVPLETATLSASSKRIRHLMVDMAKNALALGAELSTALEHFPVGPRGQRMGWKRWLKDECALSDSYAKRLIQVHGKFGHLARGSREMPSLRVLALLVPQKIPESARTEVLERHAKGERVGAGKAKEIVKKHLPSPKKANEIAQQTGKPTTASDGFVYLGASDGEIKDSVARRTQVYAVREAVNCLATQKLSAADFLEYAHPHQLWKARDEHEITDAIEWLSDLNSRWGKRGKS
jgi:hypothetical protein